VSTGEVPLAEYHLARGSKGDSGMPKALVIDDSKAMRMILARSLANLGYEVSTAKDGKDALDLLERETPELSLLLVDWNMPNMNGLEFIKRLRANPRYASAPLMMVTTETEVDQMVTALEAGANEYVMKPFTDDIIEGKLRLMGVLE
jgi:two-component system, chemotaxis family, chemotaxis protein CheY